MALFADAGGVDHHQRVPILLEAHIDAVAGGAGHFGNDHAVAFALVNLRDGVDQGALAGIALADDGHQHLRGWNFFGGFG